MEIAGHSLEPIGRLDLFGPIVATADERDLRLLRGQVQALVAAGRNRVALNLTEAPTADARGLGELAWAFKFVTGAGGELVLVKPSAKVRRLLAITRLDTVIPVCDSTEAAVRMLTAPRDGRDPPASGPPGAGRAEPPAVLPAAAAS